MSGRARAATQRTTRLAGQEIGLGSGVLEEVERRARAAYLVRRAELAPRPRPADRSATTEKEWQRAILDVCATLQRFAYHPHLSKRSARGWPDLSILGTRPGEALWIEVKDDSNELSTEQVKVIDLMLACGLTVHVCRPFHGLDHVARLLSA